MKKGISFIWDNACQQASKKINRYLTHSPVLTASVSEKPFLIYVRAMDHSLGDFLAQNNDQEHEQAIYYMSRTMIGVEHQYNLILKEYLALIFAVQKMRHYFVPNHTRYIKSQSFKIAYDKAIITEWSIGKIGHIALLI